MAVFHDRPIELGDDVPRRTFRQYRPKLSDACPRLCPLAAFWRPTNPHQVSNQPMPLQDQSCGTMPASLITRPHSSTSALRNAPTWAGESGLLS